MLDPSALMLAPTPGPQSRRIGPDAARAGEDESAFASLLADAAAPSDAGEPGQAPTEEGKALDDAAPKAEEAIVAAMPPAAPLANPTAVTLALSSPAFAQAEATPSTVEPTISPEAPSPGLQSAAQDQAAPVPPPAETLTGAMPPPQLETEAPVAKGVDGKPVKASDAPKPVAEAPLPEAVAAVASTAEGTAQAAPEAETPPAPAVAVVAAGLKPTAPLSSSGKAEAKDTTINAAAATDAPSPAAAVEVAATSASSEQDPEKREGGQAEAAATLPAKAASSSGGGAKFEVTAAAAAQSAPTAVSAQAPAVGGETVMAETSAAGADLGSSPSTATSTTSTSPQAALAPRPGPTAQVGQQILRRFDGGGFNLELRLDPPELGQVTVKLEVSKEGAVTAAIGAETPAALAELVRGARELERALMAAGLDVDRRSLTFDLNDRGNGQDTRSRSEPSSRSPDGSAGDTAPAPIATPTLWRAARVNLIA